MQKFTKTEIAWIATEMAKLSKRMEADSQEVTDRTEAKLLKMRSDQYNDISQRLRVSLKGCDKRIEIK